MRHRLLIVDDELSEGVSPSDPPRRPYYEHLTKWFDLVFLDELADLSNLASFGDIHGVLLDFVLRKWGTTAETVLAQLDGRFPVGLISGRWGPNFEKLRVVLATHPEVSQIFTWEDLEDPERLQLVAMWLMRAIDGARGQDGIALQDDEPIRILHLSDLQFGSVPPAKFATETDAAAQEIRRIWKAAPHFIAVTGDITERGMPTEFEAARTWLDQLARNMDPKWDHRRLLVVPGNHDLCWPLGLASRVDPVGKALDSGANLRSSELLSASLMPFREFCRVLGGEGNWNGSKQFWTSGRFRHLGIVLLGYNSCEEVDSWSMPTRKGSDSTLSQAFAEVRSICAEDSELLVIGLIHHPLESGPPEDRIVNPDLFHLNISGLERPLMIINGHVHDAEYGVVDRGRSTFLEVTASTATKAKEARPDDTLRGFNLLELARKGGKVESVKVTSVRFERSKIEASAPVVFKRYGKVRFLRQ